MSEAGHPPIVLGHQTNCLSRSPRKLAEAVFGKYPAANDYARGDNHNMFGRTKLHEVASQAWVANLYGQWHQGKIKRGETERSRLEALMKALTECVKALRQQNNDNVVMIVPARIGCASAGCGEEFMWNNGLKSAFAKLNVKRIIFTYFESELANVPKRVIKLKEWNGLDQ